MVVWIGQTVVGFGLTLLSETETLNDTGRTTTSNEAGS